jgi:hypothetical protein
MSNKKKPLSFTLYDLERASTQKSYKLYEELIIELLNFMDQRINIETLYRTDSIGNLACMHQGLTPLNNQMTLNEKQDIYSRLAATITSFLSDTHHTPNDTVFIHFIIFKNYIAKIFYLSCYANMDHIMLNRDLVDGNFGLKLKTELDIKYLYACLTLNTDIAFDARQLANALPYFGMYWYLGMLYRFQHPYNKQIESNFNKVFEAHPVIKDMELDSTAAELTAAPWMLCSYLDRSDRHEMKASINIAIENWVTTKLISPGMKKKVADYITKTSGIKKIVVLSEHYSSQHAMYRCYHPELKLLKEKFHVTLVSDPTEYDKLSSQDFDNIINIKDTAEDMSDVIKKIIKLEPDLIFFPSLGMAKWTIPLANVRLAKYQMMCYGHPASAFSKYIDFSYSSEPKEEWDFQQFCMEKIVPVYPGKDFIWEPHPEYKPLDTHKPNDGVVRIAINSSLPKITPRFIHMCQLLLEHSSIPIEFNFFLISHDLAFEKSVIARLNGAIRVHPPTDYMSYMNRLSNCDLAIGTFPFGGSNTNTDLALLGIPKVFYSEGCGIASYADQTALEKLNLPEILTPESEGELLANLIYLIHDNSMRNELSDKIKSSNPYKLFYAQKTNKDAEASCKLVSAIHWIEENHSAQKMNKPNKDHVNLSEKSVDSLNQEEGQAGIDLGDQLSQLILDTIKKNKY